MLGAAGVGGNKRQINRGLQLSAQLTLGFFRSLFESLMSHRVATQVDTFGLFELIGQVVYQRLVQIIAAKMCVAIGT